jgi:cell division protein FtsQ
VRAIEVAGTSRIPGEWAAARLERFEGSQLLAVSVREVRDCLADHPWIASAGMRKRLPDVLEVELVERRPAGLLRRDEELYYLDAGGDLIAPYDPAFGGADLMLVSYAGRPPVPLAETLELVEEIQRGEPAWALGLSEIEILGEGDYRLFTSVLPFPLLLRSGRVGEAIARLERALPQIRRRYARLAALDLRFDRRIIVQPMTRASGAAPGV